jgi:hypothetical protein
MFFFVVFNAQGQKYPEVNNIGVIDLSLKKRNNFGFDLFSSSLIYSQNMRVRGIWTPSLRLGISEGIKFSIGPSAGIEGGFSKGIDIKAGFSTGLAWQPAKKPFWAGVSYLRNQFGVYGDFEKPEVPCQSLWVMAGIKLKITEKRTLAVSLTKNLLDNNTPIGLSLSVNR